MGGSAGGTSANVGGRKWTENHFVKGRDWKCHVEGCINPLVPATLKTQAASVTNHLRKVHLFDIPLSEKRRKFEDGGVLVVCVCVCCVCV